MKSYYYFVRDMVSPSVETFVYHVGVGTSEREQTKFELVREYCKDCGMYFEKVSSDSDKAISNLQKSLFGGSAFIVSPLSHAKISIAQLYDFIIDDSFDAFEKSYICPKGTHIFRSRLFPILHCKEKRKKIKSPLLTPARKYLKSGNAAELDSFLINSLVVAIIFLIAGYLEGRFVYGL